MQLPEYTKPIHTEDGEAVLSTPPWFDKHSEKTDEGSRIVTVFVDARAWPPKLVEHRMRTAAATRLPDGRWACVAKREGTWSLYWFASIAATTPSHVESLPFEAPPPAPTATEDDEPPDDTGPIEILRAFAGKLLAFPFEGAAWSRDGDGPWREHAALEGKRYREARIVTIGGKPHLEWNEVLYDAELRPVDALDCTLFWSAGGRVLALHNKDQFVEFADPPVPELAGHSVSGIVRGPRDTLILTFERDDERGTSHERVLYDPLARTVTPLADDLLGEYPKFLASTTAGDLVMHVERDHTLRQITAAQLAELPTIPAADLVAPPRIELPALDGVGSASRVLVATTDDAITMALGSDLRVHTVDQPKAIILQATPIVATAALGNMVAALTGDGVLHIYLAGGEPIEDLPVVSSPRALTTGLGGWLAVGADRVVLVDASHTLAIEIAAPLAVAADPDTDELVIACDDRRLAHWVKGELRDLPPPIEQVVAIASLGDRKFACAGTRGLYLLDLAMPELVRLDPRPRRPFLAANGKGRLAYCPTAGSVEVSDLQGTELVRAPKGNVHYSSYSEPDNTEVTVHGLAFMDDGRLVIQLDEGRGNIVDPETGSALKLDPQPGDARSRWIFITGAGILIAD